MSQEETTLFVSHMAHLSEYALIKLFEPFGELKQVKYLFHTSGPRKGEPRDYAFVQFIKRKDAERALSLNEHQIKGRKMQVRWSQEENPMEPQQQHKEKTETSTDKIKRIEQKLAKLKDKRFQPY